MTVNATATEFRKLRTLPKFLLTISATALIVTAMAALFADTSEEMSVTSAVVSTVVFGQIGIILLGILPMSHEYAGGQLRTSLTAVPVRRVLLLSKSFTTFTYLAATSLLTVCASTMAAVLTRMATDGDYTMTSDDYRYLLGVCVYFVLIGMLAFAVSVLVRHLIPSLVGMLAVVLIASPLLAGVTEHARWLPDRAAMLLYGAEDTVLNGWTGPLVGIGWVVAFAAVGAVRFVRTDV